jgi:hypothetical protein
VSRPSADGLRIAETGGFHIGGQGDPVEGQVYVSYTRLAEPRGRYALVAWPGGGLTGASFDDAPDGRPGWRWLFLSRGHDVLVCDGVGAGRAGWHPRSAEPLIRGKAALWELFRIGPPGSYARDPAERRPYQDTRFPVTAFDEFARQVVPVNRDGLTIRQRGYDDLVRKVGPCVLLTHSAAGPYGMRAALAAPRLLRAHIAIEPSGAPDLSQVDITSLRHIPHLFIWGDHLDDDGWRQEYDSAHGFHRALLDDGGTSDWIDLPGQGIRGNSHLLMMDDNSGEIAGMICDWLARQNLAR